MINKNGNIYSVGCLLVTANVIATYHYGNKMNKRNKKKQNNKYNEKIPLTLLKIASHQRNITHFEENIKLHDRMEMDSFHLKRFSFFAL